MVEVKESTYEGALSRQLDFILVKLSFNKVFTDLYCIFKNL